MLTNNSEIQVKEEWDNGYCRQWVLQTQRYVSVREDELDEHLTRPVRSQIIPT
jgi:hypothetical protein